MTTRELLKKCLADKNLKAILFGEYHMASFTEALIIANLDLFLACDRPVVFLDESYNQQDNPTLIKAEHTQNPALINNINTINFLTTYSLLITTALLSQGLALRGTETKETNPVLDMDLDNIDLEASKAYENSDSRITKPNQEFAKVINTYIDQGYLVIFIGGAIHPVTLYRDGKMFDHGIQGRLRDQSITINLLEKSREVIKSKASYRSLDLQFTGEYDYLIESNDDDMYKQSFLDCKTIEEKKDKLAQLMLILFKTREHFPKTDKAIPYFFNSILECFKKALDCKSLDFTALKNLNAKTNLNASQPKQSSYTFVRFFENKMRSFLGVWNLENALQKAIDQDLQGLTKTRSPSN